MAARKAFPPLAFLVILSACSLDYEEARLAEEIAAETPETVMVSFTHTVVVDGKVWVKLTADRAESYEKRKQIILQGVSFQEYDSQGKLATEARADHAVFYSETEDATAAGSIVIRSPGEESTLRAQTLSWFKEGKRLEAGPQESVRLEKQDGSFVEGRGFKADFRRKRMEFSSGVRGSYVWEEKQAGQK